MGGGAGGVGGGRGRSTVEPPDACSTVHVVRSMDGSSKSDRLCNYRRVFLLKSMYFFAKCQIFLPKYQSSFTNVRVVFANVRVVLQTFE